MSSPTTPLAGPNQADILRGYGEWAVKRAGGVHQTDNLVYLALQCSQRLEPFIARVSWPCRCRPGSRRAVDTVALGLQVRAAGMVLVLWAGSHCPGDPVREL